jgi:hypothetical protein
MRYPQWTGVARMSDCRRCREIREIVRCGCSGKVGLSEWARGAGKDACHLVGTTPRPGCHWDGRWSWCWTRCYGPTFVVTRKAATRPMWCLLFVVEIRVHGTPARAAELRCVVTVIWLFPIVIQGYSPQSIRDVISYRERVEEAPHRLEAPFFSCCSLAYPHPKETPHRPDPAECRRTRRRTPASPPAPRTRSSSLARPNRQPRPTSPSGVFRHRWRPP